MSKNPGWTREELILALDLYTEHHRALPSEDSEPVAELSGTLNHLASALGLVAGDKRFRNRASVYMKLMNFLHHDPSYSGVGLSAGSKLDKEVWEEFSGDRDALQRAADAIRHELAFADRLDLAGARDEDVEEFPEGRLAQRLHSVRERNATLVRRKKQRALSRSGRISCEVCGFDFLETYGELGHGFIECHHLIPVGDWPEGRMTTRLEDTALVCSNCHRMLHRRRPWPSIGQLKELLHACVQA